MTRHPVARLVVRVLPTDVAADRRAEIEGTLLDAGEQSRSAFVTESASLLRVGLAARARSAVDQPVSRMARDMLGWASVLIAGSLMVHFLYVWLLIRPPGIPTQLVCIAIVLPSVILLLWSTGFTRAAGLTGIIWAVWSLADVSSSAGPAVLLDVKVALVGFLVLAVTPARPRPRFRLLWLVPAAMLMVNLFALDSLSFGVLTLLVIACVLPLAPAFGLGAALSWSAWSLNAVLIVPTATASPFQIVLIASPLAALAGVVATKRLTLART